MTATDEYADALDMQQQYIEASCTTDVLCSESVLHPDASVAGYPEGVLDAGTSEPLYADLEANPSAREAGEPYHGEITFVQIAGPVARAAIVGNDLLGLGYVNHPHNTLACIPVRGHRG